MSETNERAYREGRAWLKWSKEEKSSCISRIFDAIERKGKCGKRAS